MHVHTHQHDPLFVFLNESLGELGSRGRLASALQTGEEDHHRRLSPQINPLMLIAKQRHQFRVENFDEFLARPLPQRQQIAQQLRRDSAAAMREKTSEIMDVNAEAVAGIQLCKIFFQCKP